MALIIYLAGPKTNIKKLGWDDTSIDSNGVERLEPPGYTLEEGVVRLREMQVQVD